MPGGALWTEQETRIIAESVYLGESVDETAERFAGRVPKRTRKTIQNRRSHESVMEIVQRMRTGAEPAPRLFEVSTPAEESRVRPDELWTRAKEVTARQIRYQRDRHLAEVAFVTRKPIALSFISDQHISQGGAVDLEQMEADARLICETPGMFAVMGGDGVDNHLKHRAALVNSGSVPGKEWVMYDHYLSMFGHKICGMISGNHDDWTHDFAGIDMVQQLAERRRVFYAPDYIVMSVKLKATPEDPGQEYVVKVRHQYRYSSSFNQTHSIKRLWEMDEHDFDIGVLCHHHEAAMEPFKKHGVWRYALRPGAYQITTGHSRRYGYARSEPMCPTVVIYPGTRRIVPFLDVRDAAVHLGAVRAITERAAA